MLSIAVILMAAAVYFGVDQAKIAAVFESVRSKVSVRQLIALALVALAFALLPLRARRDPVPQPVPSGPLSLEGRFTGPTASEDASLIGCLLTELADEIEWDGMQPEPFFKTGVSIDHLRKTARLLRCRGISIGDRQPAARDAIADYLESKVGTDGGPLSAEQRAAWVTAFRDAGRAANDAAN